MDNGVSPAITTIPNRELPATGKVLLLNPLNDLPLAVDPTRLRFELTFTRTDGEERTSISVDLAPAQYDNHAALQLPVGA